MINTFFNLPYTRTSFVSRLSQLNSAKVGFYSVGLYPASLAYNCAMQNSDANIMLAPRPGRKLFGAFSEDSLRDMDLRIKSNIEKMAIASNKDPNTYNTLEDLILNCEIIILSSNSKHIESDLKLACQIRKELSREEVVIACLVGSFCHDTSTNESYVLCEREPNLGFFSGFHRHGALRNPLDSFTANFCHPDSLTALLGAKILNKISPNIQVAAGVHNIEGQYIKAAKNISSIFAGFGHTFHSENPGLLPTLLTLLFDQCLDQAAYVSMNRKDRESLYASDPFPITELGYGVQRIEASLARDGDYVQVRDHTFSQLTAMVADVRGSMMLPVSGKPTRNFQAGQVLARKMKSLSRCPLNIDEFVLWCKDSGLQIGGLEGINSLKYWPQIISKYSIPFNDCSIINLLYMCLFGPLEIKENIFDVFTNSRELTSYCQESVRPKHSRKYAEAISNLNSTESIEFLANSILDRGLSRDIKYKNESNQLSSSTEIPSYLKVMNTIETQLLRS